MSCVASAEQELIEDFLADQKIVFDRSQRTVDAWRTAAKKWTEWCIDNNIDIVDPPEDSFSDFLKHAKRQNEDIADTYLSNLRAGISTYYQWGVDEDRFESNPLDGWTWDDTRLSVNPERTAQERYIDRNGLEGSKALYLSPEDVDTIAQNVGSPAVRNELVIRLLYHTAMRVSELESARLSNTDFEKGEIRIQSAKTDDGDRHHWRTVYFSDTLKPLFRKWLRQRAGYKYVDESDRLFLTQHKPKMRSTYASQLVKEAAKRAGMNEKMDNGRWLITGHTLRHASITHQVNETDIDIHIVKEVAGHASLDTTLQYVHTSDEEKRRQVRRNLP